MIIWGWRTVFRVVGSGVFSCPSCNADRDYQRRRAQRFFTLFFIPLIPLKTIGEFIRCVHCKTDFRESVLQRPTAAQFTDLLQNSVRAVMVNMLRRGGAAHPAARAVAVEEIVSAGAVGYSEQNLAQDMQVVPEDVTQLLARPRRAVARSRPRGAAARRRPGRRRRRARRRRRTRRDRHCRRGAGDDAGARGWSGGVGADGGCGFCGWPAGCRPAAVQPERHAGRHLVLDGDDADPAETGGSGGPAGSAAAAGGSGRRAHPRHTAVPAKVVATAGAVMMAVRPVLPAGPRQRQLTWG